MEKATFRKILIEQRDRIPGAEAAAASEAIAALIFGERFWAEARSVFCFIGTGKELDTLPIAGRALAEGKILCVPRTAPGRHMEAVPVTGAKNASEFRRALAGWPLSFGIPEPPASYPATAAGSLDLVIVPSLAVDRQGYRLGYGGGYYDSFIAHFRTWHCKAPFFVAIQFAALIQEGPLPREDYDMRVDLVVTEKGIIIPLLDSPCSSC